MIKFKETEIPNCFEIEVPMYEDDRGHFLVPFNKDLFTESRGYFSKFIQDNESYSKYGTIRGLHYQKKEHAQSKLVHCSYGRVLDVVVDIRPNSPSFKKVLTFELFKPNKMVFVPKGCLHGFSVLSDEAVFNYKVDRPYNKESENGVVYNDPTFNIDWRVPYDKVLVSKKDLELPYFI